MVLGQVLLNPFYRRGRVYKRKFCVSMCLCVCLSVFVVPALFLWLFMVPCQCFMIPGWFLWFFIVPGLFKSELSAGGAK